MEPLNYQTARQDRFMFIHPPTAALTDTPTHRLHTHRTDRHTPKTHRLHPPTSCAKRSMAISRVSILEEEPVKWLAIACTDPALLMRVCLFVCVGGHKGDEKG
jgi:hypothetical protein